MSGNVSIKYLSMIIVGLVGIRLFCASLFPPLQDEAYYFYWARYLDFGYFDHPPLIAWLSSLHQMIPNSSLAARAGTVILGFLSIPLFLSLCRTLGVDTQKRKWLGLLLASGNLTAMLSGFIATPDIPMIFFWIAALHEAAYALTQNPKRWLSAGVMTGLGILGKYTMLLMGPIFLIALLAQPKQLRKPWPYLGGLLCLFILLPHILWLARHDWITLRFQFDRGLKSEYGVLMQEATDLPKAQRAFTGSEEFRLASYFIIPEDEQAKASKPPSHPFLRKMQGFFNFTGSQLMLWGFTLIPIAWSLRKTQRLKATWPHRSVRILAWTATLFPLSLFAALSPFQHIEANWSAMYLIAASVVIIQYRDVTMRSALLATGLNAALCALLLLHSVMPLHVTKPHRDRILRETRGYRELAHHLDKQDLPLFADNYQNLSQLAYYLPHRKLQQWPGAARNSELIRRPEMTFYYAHDRSKWPRFLLVLEAKEPPYIPGAKIVRLTEALDCLDGKLQLTESFHSPDYQRACEKRIHRWLIAEYRWNKDSA